MDQGKENGTAMVAFLVPLTACSLFLKRVGFVLSILQWLDEFTHNPNGWTNLNSEDRLLS
jgi:hypothetical protein